MRYYSTGNNSVKIPFREAVINGIAEDGGLYLPADIPLVPSAFFRNMSEMSLSDIAYVVLSTFTGDEISSEKLKEIITAVTNYPIPVVSLAGSNLFSAELFHGPSGSSKDLGVGFMAEFFSIFFNQSTDNKVTILTYSHSDYGLSVAKAFSKSGKFKVIIVYPKGRITPGLRYRLLNSGTNIIPVEVRGSAADCLAMMRSTLIDETLRENIILTSANSINISSLLPLVIQYFYIMAKMVEDGADPDSIVISVPCGSLANLSAVLIANQMGLPIKRIVAAYPETSDVTPINSIRVEDLLKTSKTPVSSVTITEDDINTTRNLLKDNYGYEATDHSCLSAAALLKEMRSDEYGAFMATSDPIVKENPMEFQERHESISPTYNALKRIILNNTNYIK